MVAGHLVPLEAKPLLVLVAAALGEIKRQPPFTATAVQLGVKLVRG